MLARIKYRLRCLWYHWLYCGNQIKSNMVLYESFWGRAMVDNPYALFRELLNREAFKNLEHVWVLDDPKQHAALIEQYREYPNVRFVKYASNEYMKALVQAKYLINNTTFVKYFRKKEKQIYINTWHGTPIKSMGYEVAGSNSGLENIIRNFLCADYLLSANSVMTTMYEKSYRLEGSYRGRILEEGYPRNDLLFHTSPREAVEKLEKLGIHIKKGKKIILYAPTWRENGESKAVVNPKELLEVKKRIEENLDSEEYQILIKPHQHVYKCLKDKKEYQGLLVPSLVDSNELMSIVDVLISDFSSIFIDYMVLDRPILFYIPDLEEYEKTRGLKVSPKELPGPYSDKPEEIAEYIKNLETIRIQYADPYREMKSRLCLYEDGKVSERIVNLVFGKSQEI